MAKSADTINDLSLIHQDGTEPDPQLSLTRQDLRTGAEVYRNSIVHLDNGVNARYH